MLLSIPGKKKEMKEPAKPASRREVKALDFCLEVRPWA